MVLLNKVNIHYAQENCIYSNSTMLSIQKLWPGNNVNINSTCHLTVKYMQSHLNALIMFQPYGIDVKGQICNLWM